MAAAFSRACSGVSNLEPPTTLSVNTRIEGSPFQRSRDANTRKASSPQMLRSVSKTAIATRTKEEDTFAALLIVMTLLHGTNGSMKLLTCTGVGNSEPGELLSGSSAVSAAFVTSELQNCGRALCRVDLVLKPPNTENISDVDSTPALVQSLGLGASETLRRIRASKRERRGIANRCASDNESEAFSWEKYELPRHARGVGHGFGRGMLEEPIRQRPGRRGSPHASAFLYCCRGDSAPAYPGSRLALCI